MRKSTVFISAVLTTFALVMLYGVVSAYRTVSTTVAEAAAPENTSTPEPTLEPATAIPTVPAVFLTPEQAAQLAVQVTGNPGLLSAESSVYNGLNAYMITFTNNDVVYVGLDGQILSVQVAPVVVNVSAPAQHKEKHDSGGSHEDSHDDDHQESGDD